MLYVFLTSFFDTYTHTYTMMIKSCMSHTDGNLLCLWENRWRYMLTERPSLLGGASNTHTHCLPFVCVRKYLYAKSESLQKFFSKHIHITNTDSFSQNLIRKPTSTTYYNLTKRNETSRVSLSTLIAQSLHVQHRMSVCMRLY